MKCIRGYLVPGVTAFSYTYDANKNVTAETDGILNAYAFTAGYDDQDRLTSWTRSNGDSQTWNLTGVGDWDDTTINGVLQDRTHNAVHEIETVDAASLAHDAKGNLTREAGDSTDRYTYDFDNHLASADTDQNGAADAAYTYDALGRRVSKTISGQTWVFVSMMQGGGQTIAEYGSGALPANATQQYIYGTYIDEPIMMIDSNGTKHYHHANRMFSIAAVTDSTGAVVERYTYTPYGEQTVRDTAGNVHPASTVYATTYTLGHQGLMHDDLTGLVYNRARMLHPRLGQFAQRDPLRYVDGMNLHQYEGSTPLGRHDPSGLYWVYYDVPATPAKCATVSLGMDVMSRAQSSVDADLWYQYRYGHGKNLVLDIDDFDTEGRQQDLYKRLILNGMKTRIMEAAADLECGEKKRAPISLPAIRGQHNISQVAMISTYNFSAVAYAMVRKDCDENKCCEGLSATVRFSFSASDRTDFDRGGFGNGYVYVTDRLVRTCNLGTPFNISGHSSDTGTLTGACDSSTGEYKP